MFVYYIIIVDSYVQHNIVAENAMANPHNSEFCKTYRVSNK